MHTSRDLIHHASHDDFDTLVEAFSQPGYALTAAPRGGVSAVVVGAQSITPSLLRSCMPKILPMMGIDSPFVFLLRNDKMSTQGGVLGTLEPGLVVHNRQVLMLCCPLW